MSKKKLLFVVEAFGGGIFSFLVDLTNELIENYEIYIAHAIREETPEKYSEYFNKSVKLIHLNEMTRAISVKSDIKAFIALRKIKKEINPDIIHVHSSKAGVLGRWAFNSRKTPVFYTPHAYSFLSIEGNTAKKKIYKFIEYISAKTGATTISCGKSEHEETLQMTRKAEFVPNGINIKNISGLLENVEVSEKTNKFTVCTMCRVSFQKNPHLFNDIALKMPDVKFVWVGDGNMRDVLTAPNIEITGWLSKEEALKKVMQSDVFMLTSISEGLSYALLEAMYLKKPCIVSNVIGNKDVIRDMENGFLGTTSDEFVDKINYVRNNDVDKITEEAHREIFDIYNTKTMANGYKEIYEGGK